MSILVTGATGFVGSALVAEIKRAGYDIKAAVRKSKQCRADIADIETISVGDLGPDTEWSRALEDVTEIIHLAARVHVMDELANDALAEYRKVNVEGTRRLAQAAADAGVRRLVFLSSIKVNGERTINRPFTAHDQPAPEDPYAVSKWEAEQALKHIAGYRGLEVVIVRAPLVYGPDVKGNFLRLMRWIEKGVPLPLGAINNRRSLVALPNLVDLLVRCVKVPHAAGQTFLVSDGHDISTPELIRLLAAALRCQSRLIPVPPRVLTLAGRMFGREATINRLAGSLQADIRHTRETLGWRPPVSVENGIRQAVLHSR